MDQVIKTFANIALPKTIVYDANSQASIPQIKLVDLG